MGIFGNAFSGWHLLNIVLVVLVLFGASKLPVFAKGLGQSIKIFKKEMEDVRGDDKKSTQGQARAEDPERPVVYTNEPPATGTQARRTPEDH